MSCRSLDTAFCRISPHLPEGVPSSLGWWVKACGREPTLSRPLSSISQQGSNFLMVFRTAWGLHLTSSHLSPELILSFPSPCFPFATLCTVFAPGLLGVPFFILCDPIASSIFYSAWSPQQLWYCILFIFFYFYIRIRVLSVHYMSVVNVHVCGVTFMYVGECTHLYTSEVHRRTLGALLYLVLPCPGEVVPDPLHLGGVSTPLYLGGVSLSHLTLKWASLPCLTLG